MKAIRSFIHDNGITYLISIVLSMGLLHLYSSCAVYTGLKNQINQLSTQHAADLESAVKIEDLAKIREILRKISSNNVEKLEFRPNAELNIVFPVLRVGSQLPDSTGEKRELLSLYSNGTFLGTIEYNLDLMSLQKKTFQDNLMIYVIVPLLVFILLLIANIKTIRSHNFIRAGLDELNLTVAKGNLSELDEVIKRQESKMPYSGVSKDYRKMINNFWETLKMSNQLRDQLAISESISKFAEQTAHDLKSPLGAITTGLASIQNVSPTKKELLTDGIDQIMKIIDKLEIKKEDFNSQTYSLCEIELCSFLKKEISRKKMEFEFNKGINLFFKNNTSEMIFANIDPIEFSRVLSNLINNAIESLNGEGEIKVELRKVENKAVISIKDNGRGIERDVLDKIFSCQISTKGNGRGLGLPHAKEVVEKFDGLIRVESSINKGATFYLSLPLLARV